MTFSTYQYARMAAQTLTVTTNVTLFTVPASTQYIVKDINIANANGTPITIIWLLINGVPIIQNMVMPAGSVMRETGLWVANAAETMVMQVNVANVVFVTVNGQTGQ